MHILFIDNDSLQTKTRRALIEHETDCTTELAQSLGEVHLKFKKDQYDLVVIDPTIEGGDLCAEHVLDEAPQQHILVVSNAARCIVTRCEDCASGHNIRRLANPTPLSNIIRMVTGLTHHECDHYDGETSRLENKRTRTLYTYAR